MTYGRHVQTYRANQVVTADPGTILLLLYQGTIDFLNQAKTALGQRDVAEKGRCISRALAIISELLSSLNFEVGGEVARNLESLYLFMIDQVTTANIHNDPKPLEDTIKLLGTLKEGWEGAVATERKRVQQESQTAAQVEPQVLAPRSHEYSVAVRA
jgi:flagellar protein FliS